MIKSIHARDRWLAWAIISLLLAPQSATDVGEHGNPHEIRVSRTTRPAAATTITERKGTEVPESERRVPEKVPYGSRPVRYRKQGSLYVYVIGSGWNDPVKIGISAEPRQRLGDLQTSTPHKLRILVMFRGTRKDEKALHHRFKVHRLTGEWFQRSRAINDFIANVASDLDEIKAPAEPNGFDAWISKHPDRAWAPRP